MLPGGRDVCLVAGAPKLLSMCPSVDGSNSNRLSVAAAAGMNVDRSVSWPRGRRVPSAALAPPLSPSVRPSASAAAAGDAGRQRRRDRQLPATNSSSHNAVTSVVPALSLCHLTFE